MRKIWSPKTILPAFIIATFYVAVTVYLMNASLVQDALFGTHSLSYRWNILMALLVGMWTAMSGVSLFLLTTFERLRSIRSSGKMYWAIGGSSILGVVGSGCASCGLPILALLGLGGAAAYLPFQGAELSLVAIILLAVSLYVLVKGQVRQTHCAVKSLKYQEQYAQVLE